MTDNKLSVEEGNKIIAEFMGCKTGISGWGQYTTPFGSMSASELKYHSSSEWLMMVVEKCHNECSYYTGGLKYFKGLTVFSTKPQIWKSVIEFITWYQNQSTLTPK